MQAKHAAISQRGWKGQASLHEDIVDVSRFGREPSVGERKVHYDAAEHQFGLYEQQDYEADRSRQREALGDSLYETSYR